MSEMERLRASSRRYDATTWLSPASASPIARTLARSNMVVERNRTNNTAPRATAITTYQKRERSILVPFPSVDFARHPFGNRQGHVDDGPAEHEGSG